MTNQNRRRTAYHEAGHAVIGTVLGMRCFAVSIKPNRRRGEDGHCIMASSGDVATDVKMILAGRESEMLFVGALDHNLVDTDLVDVVKLLDDAKIDWSWLYHWRTEVIRLILENERTVRRVARALLQQRTIGQGRIEEIIAMHRCKYSTTYIFAGPTDVLMRRD